MIQRQALATHESRLGIKIIAYKCLQLEGIIIWPYLTPCKEIVKNYKCSLYKKT